MPITPEQISSQVDALGNKKAKRKRLTGQPADTKEKKLPKDVRQGLEKHFGAKLSKVRVHQGGNIKELCRSVKARAFTLGNDIYFMKPADAKNTDMLVHELAHVLQQGRGKMPKPKDGIVLTSK